MTFLILKVFDRHALRLPALGANTEKYSSGIAIIRTLIEYAPEALLLPRTGLTHLPAHRRCTITGRLSPVGTLPLKVSHCPAVAFIGPTFAVPARAATGAAEVAVLLEITKGGQQAC